MSDDKTKGPVLHAHTRALHDHLLPATGKIRSDRTQVVHDLSEPLHDALEQVEDELRSIRRKLRRARSAETHEQGTGFFERIQNTLDAADRQMTTVRNELGAVQGTLAQLDSYALEWQRSNETYDARVNPAVDAPLVARTAPVA